MAMITIEKPEPITFRDADERDAWTQASIAFAAAAWSNPSSKFRTTAAEMADSVIRERRAREQRAPASNAAATILHAAELIRDDRGDCATVAELNAIADALVEEAGR